MDEKEIQHLKLEHDISEVLSDMIADGCIVATINEVTGDEEFSLAEKEEERL